jgi:predicted nucleotidyltransferase
MKIKYKFENLRKIARSWEVRRIAVFGSQVNGNAMRDSDIDILIDFEPQFKPTLIGHIKLQDQLSKLFQIQADLTTFDSIKSSDNEARKNAILSSCIDIYHDA